MRKKQTELFRNEKGTRKQSSQYRRENNQIQYNYNYDGMDWIGVKMEMEGHWGCGCLDLT